MSLRGTALKLAVSTASRRLPAHVRFPLQRDGVDPVPRLDEARARGDVVRLTRLLGTRVWLVTGHDDARAVLADSDHATPTTSGHLLGRPPPAPAEAGVGGLGMTDASRPRPGCGGLLTPDFTQVAASPTCSDIETGVVADGARPPRHGRALGREVDLVEPVSGSLWRFSACKDAERSTGRTWSSAGPGALDLRRRQRPHLAHRRRHPTPVLPAITLASAREPALDGLLADGR